MLQRKITGKPRRFGHNAEPAKPLALHDFIIVKRALSDLHPNSGNPRIHSKRKIRDLAETITKIGIIMPILVDESGLIIAGHARYEAAKLLGLGLIPTISVEGLSREQRDIFILADNKFAERAGWDRAKLASFLEDLEIRIDPLELDLSLTGFEAPELDIIFEESGLDDHAPEDIPPPTAGAVITRPGEIWTLGRHRLICGDARSGTDVSRLMQGLLADAVVTDPPFNVPVAGHVQGRGRVRHREFAFGSGEMTNAEFQDFLKTCLSNATQSTRDGSVHYVFMDWRHIDALIEVGRQIYGAFLNLIVWNKGSGGQGSFYRSQHELIGVFRAGAAAHQNNVELGRHGRNRTNVWDYRGINSFGAGRDAALAMHPTVKPVAMIADALRDCTSKGGLVLDPFLGSGTTLIAAEKSGRRCFGVEYEPAFVDVAIKRWQAFTHCDAELADSGMTFDEIAAERLSAHETDPEAAVANTIVSRSFDQHEASKAVKSTGG